MIIYDYILYYKKNQSNENNATWNKRLLYIMSRSHYAVTR